MRGAFPRISKLTSVRLALSKLDAKYSKTSVAIDDDFSDEAEPEGEEVKSSSSSQIQMASQLQVENKSDNLDADLVVQILPQMQHVSVPLLGSSSEQAGNARQRSAESEQGNSPVFEENFSAEMESSIESVKTDSVLGLHNVHSVSSLAESVLPFDDEVEAENIPTSYALIGGLNSPNPLTSSTENRSGASSSMGRNGQVKVTTSDSSTLKSVQKLPPKIDTINVHLVPVENLKLENKLSEDVIPAAEILDCNTSDKNATNTNESTKSVTHHCKCKGLAGRKKKSIGVQTSRSPSRTMKPHTGRNTVKLKESSSNTPVMKATKLPFFLRDNFTKPTSKLISSFEKGALSSASDELSELISHHLYLTKEFLERQHRIYMANCKAVQLLEKGYQENTCDSFHKCTHKAS